MENAVVYARYSSHNQTEQSIEGQLAAAKKYAEAHDYRIIHEYCDRAKTGTNDNREAFQKMLKDSDKQKFTVVLVWKVDRFGRNREEIAINKYRLKKNKIRVEYIAENVSTGPEGVILESVLEGFAEYYSLQLSQNIQRGKLESAKKHQVVNGHCPLGYSIGEQKEYVINEKESFVVKKIFELYSQGMTMAEITTYLNSKGYKTSREKVFNKSSLSRILKNDTYIGTYRYKDIICDEDAIPAIISKDLFYKVQNIMKNNQKMPSHAWQYNDYLLTGKLYCGICDSAMVGIAGTSHTGSKYNYYACSAHRAHKCDSKPIRQDYIENIVLDGVTGLLSDENVLTELIDSVWQYYLDQTAKNEQLSMQTRRLEDIKRNIDRLVKSIEEGIDVALIKPRLDALSDEKAIVEEEIAKEELGTIALTREQIEYFVKQFAKGDIKDRDVQKRLISTFINKIYLFEDKISIILNYSDSPRTDVTLSKIKDYDQVRPCFTNWSQCNNRRTIHVYNGLVILTISR